MSNNPTHRHLLAHGAPISDDGKCTECGKGIGHFVTCSQHPDYEYCCGMKGDT